ncbi:hypothetical protein BD289DRAFT_142017 [Coniella lustricola]|uniref:Uncharacterized protein n=1 Tax=Coniella lustricola TaxID=2025994 RepID=A0A2T2ZVB0_9PEZI|nr:hypothetical protein BD289DRAFT_142017 [Coniella lustricola]
MGFRIIFRHAHTHNTRLVRHFATGPAACHLIFAMGTEITLFLSTLNISDKRGHGGAVSRRMRSPSWDEYFFVLSSNATTSLLMGDSGSCFVLGSVRQASFIIFQTNNLHLVACRLQNCCTAETSMAQVLPPPSLYLYEYTVIGRPSSAQSNPVSF